jgi:hypothetical protein
VIAKNRVMADLQRRNARRLPITRLQRGDGAAAVTAGGAKRIQGSVIALGDVTAL